MGSWGVGMPQELYLEEFGQMLRAVFGNDVYMVGSATRTTAFRDVDVRAILDAEEWVAWFPRLKVQSVESDWQRDPAWASITRAFAELGRRVTGLPIDFQVQPVEYANSRYPPSAGHARHPIGLPPREATGP